MRYACPGNYGLTLLTPPAAEPLELAEAKVHLRVDHTADDDDIQDLIVAARELVEEQCGQSLLTQTWQLALDRFPPWQLYLLRGPVQSVTSIVYQDYQGVTQTVGASTYRVSLAEGLVEPVWAGYWPPIQIVAGGVVVTFLAGYGPAPGDVPRRAKQAIKLLVGHWWRNREAVGTVGAPVELAFNALVGSLWDGRWSQ